MKNVISMIFILVSVLSQSSFAGDRCLLDGRGMAQCSKYSGGEVMKEEHGMVVCGKGECAKDAAGKVMCAKRDGGGAIKISTGIVVCVGGCEPASLANCVMAQP
jgi:hypothetical protein